MNKVSGGQSDKTHHHFSPVVAVVWVCSVFTVHSTIEFMSFVRLCGLISCERLVWSFKASELKMTQWDCGGNTTALVYVKADTTFIHNANKTWPRPSNWLHWTRRGWCSVLMQQPYMAGKCVNFVRLYQSQYYLATMLFICEEQKPFQPFSCVHFPPQIYIVQILSSMAQQLSNWQLSPDRNVIGRLERRNGGKQWK